MMVPEVGIEPTFPREHDFESCASANSATPAQAIQSISDILSRVKGHFMKLGIIGLPQSGKTTLFNALTRAMQPTGVTGKIEVHTAVVDVPDARVDKFFVKYKAKKTIYTKVTYVDIGGLDGSANKGGISGTLLNQLTQLDGFIEVVRVFEDENVIHINETVDPLRDIQSMDSEFLLNDLISVERKLERLAEEKKK